MATASGTKTNIGTKETFLDRNAKLIPSDETTMALTNAKWIAGHHTVATKEDLYNIYPFILNPKYYANSDEDTNHVETIGQLWYVVADKAFYQLIDWNNRGNDHGWSKTNIKAFTGPGGTDNSVGIGLANNSDFISKIKIYGDGQLEGETKTFQNEQTNNTGKITNLGIEQTINYDNAQVITYSYIDHNGKLWTEASALRQPVHQISVVSNANKVTLSYNGISNGNNKSTQYNIDLPIASDTNAGIITGSTYNSFLKKSPLPGNEVEYIWTGTRENYNKLGSEVANHPDTLFIIRK